MDPHQIRRLIRKWAFMVAGLAVGSAALAYVISSTMTPQYEASGSLLVVAAPQQQAQNPAFNATTSQVTSTYAVLMTANPVLAEVIAELRLNETPRQLASHIKASAQPETEILNVSVTDPDREQAAQIANTLMTDFVARVSKQHQAQISQAGDALIKQMDQTKQDLNSAEQQLAAAKRDPKQDPTPLLDQIKADHDVLTQLTTSYSSFSATQAQTLDNVVPVSSAPVPDSPSSPKVILNTTAGGLAGLLLAMVLALLFEYLDQGLRSEEDVRQRLGITTLGVVPNFPASSGTRSRDRRRNERTAEAFRRLRTNLQFCAVDTRIGIIVITSSRQGEGKTSVSANLAQIVAASGQRVLLVDADMRRPSQHVLFSKPLDHGLSEMLLAAAQGPPPATDRLHPTAYPNLTLLTAGTIPPNPAELLASRYTPQVLRILESIYDLVIIDTPPVDAVTDALGLTAAAHATILVVRAGSSARQAQRTIDALRRVGSNVVGIVLNKARENKAAGYYYYDYYGPAASRNGRGSKATEARLNGMWAPIRNPGPGKAPTPVSPRPPREP